MSVRQTSQFPYLASSTWSLTSFSSLRRAANRLRLAEVNRSVVLVDGPVRLEKLSGDEVCRKVQHRVRPGNYEREKNFGEGSEREREIEGEWPNGRNLKSNHASKALLVLF